MLFFFSCLPLRHCNALENTYFKNVLASHSNLKLHLVPVWGEETKLWIHLLRHIYFHPLVDLTTCNSSHISGTSPLIIEETNNNNMINNKLLNCMELSKMKSLNFLRVLVPPNPNLPRHAPCTTTAYMPRKLWYLNSSQLL